MGSEFEEVEFAASGPSATTEPASETNTRRGFVFVVEDDELLRDSLEPILEEAGYDVAFAENGCEALALLRAGSTPDIILFDLAMPAMDGWEFRTIQKSDPLLGHVPAVAITADGSHQARAISADAYLRKPFEPALLLDTISRILGDRTDEGVIPGGRGSGLTALARLASAVGHEINNPLTIVLLNVTQAAQDLGSSVLALETPLQAPLTDRGADELRANLLVIAGMLDDGKAGAERIRETVAKLATLTHHDHSPPALVDLHLLIDRAIFRVWSQVSEKTRLVKCFGKVPRLQGDAAALEQVFVNLLSNAVEAIPADAEGWNEIRVVTRVEPGELGHDAVVEVFDSGVGLSAEAAARMFEPFFTTKPIGSGDGTGLGLATARQKVIGHGGRITVEPQPTRGAVARVSLPISVVDAPRLGAQAQTALAAPRRSKFDKQR